MCLLHGARFDLETGAARALPAVRAVRTFESRILDGEILDADQIKALADLPPREVLLAQLLAVINAPASKLARTLNEPGASLARILKAKFEGQE